MHVCGVFCHDFRDFFVLGRFEKLFEREHSRKFPVSGDDITALIDSYYDERGWDVRTGVPTRRVLEELGLAGVAEDLANEGRA